MSHPLGFRSSSVMDGVGRRVIGSARPELAARYSSTASLQVAPAPMPVFLLVEDEQAADDGARRRRPAIGVDEAQFTSRRCDHERTSLRVEGKATDGVERPRNLKMPIDCRALWCPRNVTVPSKATDTLTLVLNDQSSGNSYCRISMSPCSHGMARRFLKAPRVPMSTNGKPSPIYGQHGAIRAESCR